MKGTVEHIVYSNPSNGYHVIELMAEQDVVTVVGDLGEVNEGEEVLVTGKFITHPTFGFQFQAQSCIVQMPETSRGILRYLSCGVLPHIGPATAKKIVARFGEDSFSVIANHPEKLTDIKGISGQKAKEISQEFHRRQGIARGNLVFGTDWYFRSKSYDYLSAFWTCHCGCHQPKSLPIMWSTRLFEVF